MNRRNKAILKKNIKNKIWKTTETHGTYARAKTWDDLDKKSSEEKKVIRQRKTKKKDYNEKLGPPPGSGKKRK